ncbi:hypothetical protein AUR04nite_00700 [Glutamicibacter uratoxydans]|uniref:Calcineurin-like phosphoesterase domain-containing protein n=1 Tax=Glutamicibacter uratoxydans TaxID=43667 RepID=A0A4Y4DMG1_GLUUR|nr:metallophosphoesterase [Glutamicibacter uratoxydans]GED04538.1 hypothetical protein AUR04nite_00700 [Glutamicibacter uratoxydans]
MSLLEELTKTRQVAEERAIEKATPAGWRPSVRTDDGTATVVSKPYESGVTPDERELLTAHGFDPELWMITGGVRSTSWDVYIPKGAQGEDGEWKDKFYAFRFNAVERPQGRVNVDELLEVLDRVVELPVRQYAHRDGSDRSYVVAFGDLQLGKVDGDGTEGTLRRFNQSVERARAAIADMRVGKLGHVHLVFAGDCVEGFNSQKGTNAWRTELTITEQVRVLRRLMLHAVTQLAPHADRLTVVSVPGNHDRAMPDTHKTRSDDSWAIEALEAVRDALELSGNYNHVECYVPGVDEEAVTLSVGGRTLTHIHGHQTRSQAKLWDWWKGQTFGKHASGDADILIHGHYHHWHSEAKGDRLMIGLPALESESAWWRQTTGETGNPSGLTFTLIDGSIGDINFV